MQTAEIHHPNGRVYFTMEPAPAPPEPVSTGHIARMLSDGSLILWWDKVTDQYFPDGRKITWWKKPTLADAVGASATGLLFQFNPDGSVEATYPQGNYYWTANPLTPIPVDATEPSGITTRDGHHYEVGDHTIAVEYDDCPYPCCQDVEDTWVVESLLNLK